ncbi:hypothetical protein LWC34_23075 [Kibdelosporangium philippinense]|uniref:Uncharacterized protein n=1 Tax=Kibdelosporangium philippinense TaxID=211113 RepID=A0ABS8ZCW1_9PSEU|nr:hypothetical protein [Kibdelosporangium philippinense]MCE7005685.1 hypothetical protein [Kibdelosporangium philippinense]
MAENERPNNPAPYDPEQRKQFEQFQQYQQFLKFQEMQAQGQLPPAAGQPPVPVPPSPQPAPKKKLPGWVKFLFSKAFRRLLLLAVVIAAVAWGCSYLRDVFNVAPQDDGLGVQGGAGPGTKQSPGMPNEVMSTLYRSIASGEPTFACSSFSPTGAAAFAASFGVADCPAAVAKLKPEVAPLTRNPRIEIPEGATTIRVSSCSLFVKPGTTSLGVFIFTPFERAWIISGHETETCAPPTTTSAGPTR